jgi:hypothetical protein
MYAQLIKCQSRNLKSLNDLKSRCLFSVNASQKLQKHQVKDEGVYAEDFAPIKRGLGRLNGNNQGSEINKRLDNNTSIAYREKFETRHVGVGAKAEAEMLKTLNFQVLNLLFHIPVQTQ